jgi:hypothetical protein
MSKNSRKKLRKRAKESRQSKIPLAAQLDLQEGEIVEIESSLGLLPRTVCRIDSVKGSQLQFSVGDIYGYVDASLIKVFRRNLVEPADWDLEEIRYLEVSTKLCDCEQCRENLAEKKAAYSRKKSAAVSCC